jgi:hypothetical protein
MIGTTGGGQLSGVRQPACHSGQVACPAVKRYDAAYACFPAF